MKTLFVFACVFLPTLLSAQTFNDFLTRLNISPEGERPAIVDSFMNAADSFPYMENDTLVYFIYRGAANSVSVPGDANGWNPNSDVMNTVAGTQFWYKGAIYESDARLDYKYVLNGSNWILDSLNPFTVLGGFGPNSELRMPDHIPPPEIEFYPDIPHGALRDTMFFSTNMNNTRRIRIFIPPDYDSSSDTYPLMLFHDGLEYISLANANNVLDYLIHQGLIEPVIGVFVPPVNRSDEYAGSLQNEFGRFITEEVLPWVDGAYRTRPEPEFRSTLGASNGGNIALWLGVTYPESFGKIAAQSSNVQSSISTSLATDPLLELEFYLDIGTYDIAQLIPLVHNLRAILESRGYPHQFFEFHEGHSWGNWRAHVDLPLIQFFPGVESAERTSAPLPLEVTLAQNYPNPFNPETTIEFVIPAPAQVGLLVYDVRGRVVDSLYRGNVSAGTHRFVFDASSLPTGIYFYRLNWVNGSATRKMLLLK